MSHPRTARPPAPRFRHGTTHQCPGRCGRTMPSHLYACRSCWRKLPGSLQRAIRSTAADPALSPGRTRAFTAAAAFYITLQAAGAAAGRR